MILTQFQQQSLVAAAAAARQAAYAPYSHYHVGAALLTSSGEIVVGTNVENASYGLTICAERAAVFSAVAQGQHQFTALALVTADGGAPCGACRQVLAEFCRDLPIFIARSDNFSSIQQVSLSALLPLCFSSTNLTKE